MWDNVGPNMRKSGGEEIGLRQENLQRELTPELWFWNDLVRGS